MRRSCAAVAWLALATASCPAEATPAPPAAGGRAVLDAALAAPAAVVGVIHDVVPLDARSFLAALEVERSLAGPHAPGERVPIAWEELVQARPRRFDPGTRVLVVLEPLPGWSIWRERLGERRALGVARRGEAFLRDPDAASLEILARVLEPRPDGAEPVAALAELVARGAAPLAESAVARLDAIPGVAAQLDPASRDLLRAALLDAARPQAVREALLGWIGRRRLGDFRAALETLAAPGSPLAPEALAALAALDGGLAAARVEKLLSRPEPAVRAAALRHARADLPIATLERRMGEDPDPAVRAEAVGALVARRGVEAFPAVAPLLLEPEALPGAAAVRALGALGEPAVPLLVAWVEARPGPEARGAVLALARAGAPGTPALQAIAQSHPDESVRGLAGFLLGRPPEAH